MVTQSAVAAKKELIYAQLGEFIWDGVPYKYDESDAPDLDPTQAPQTTAVGNVLKANPKINYRKIWLDGPAKNFGEKQGQRLEKKGAVSEASIAASEQPSLWWTFDNQPYRVTKAAMIPYTVTDVDGKPKLRHILIGYMGVDPNG
jgi:hypothetical protein